jgi:hypothetical protein
MGASLTNGAVQLALIRIAPWNRARLVTILAGGDPMTPVSSPSLGTTARPH